MKHPPEEGRGKMKTPEEYFAMGASVMRSKISVWLMLQGQIELAPKVLVMSLPKFSEPEEFVIGKDK